MIIAITDALELSEKVSKANSSTEVHQLYKNLFKFQIEQISHSSIEWRILKITGDGFLITATAEKEDSDFILKWCNTMYNLFNNSEDPEIRIVAHYCENDDKELVMELDLDIPKGNYSRSIINLDRLLTNIEDDIFGYPVNTLFRIEQMFSSKAFVITDAILEILEKPEEMKAAYDQKERIHIDNYSFGPAIPIIHLKGSSTRIGFSSPPQNIYPYWLWEVEKIA